MGFGVYCVVIVFDDEVFAFGGIDAVSMFWVVYWAIERVVFV